jgi:hypothetical protein
MTYCAFSFTLDLFLQREVYRVSSRNNFKIFWEAHGANWVIERRLLVILILIFHCLEQAFAMMAGMASRL